MAARLSQVPVQVAAEPTSAAIRLSQMATQVAAIPTTAAIRLSQFALVVVVDEKPGQPFEEHGCMVAADYWN